MKCPYLPFSSILFRTPFFPFKWKEKFNVYYRSNIFKEMLFVASPDLCESYLKDMDSKRVSYSCYRYYQRACTRATPFGFFAGCSIGKIGRETQIELVNQDEYTRFSRLDMHLICILTRMMESNDKVRRGLKYYSNTSIYKVGRSIRYVEYYLHEDKRVYQIAQVEVNAILHKILKIAQNGVLFNELVVDFVKNGLEESEVIDYINQLIDSQILVSELEISLTNKSPLLRLIHKLEKLNENSIADFICLLKAIYTQLEEIDKREIGSTYNAYLDVFQNVEYLNVGVNRKHILQADMFKPTVKSTISSGIICDIQQCMMFLNRITPLNSNGLLEKFKERFSMRYEGQEVSLLNVLDTESGIGYGERDSDICPLIDDLILPQDNPPINTALTPFQCVLYKKYQKCLQKGDLNIELVDSDLSNIEVDWNDLPLTMSVMCQILQDSKSKRSIYIKSIGGSSAANLLGRFCHLDSGILKQTLDIVKKEEQIESNVIFAEIVHLPESRVGNVLLRPVLRPYEINYLVSSGVSGAFNVKLSDLYLSLRNNRIILRSKKMNKEIIPRMSTAHNYRGQNSMPIYRLLCDLQHQNGRWGLGIQWGDVAQQFDFLPRVSYRNCILSRAAWVVRDEEVLAFDKIDDDYRLISHVHTWLEKRNMPSKVFSVDNDNELYVDMTDALSIRSWLSYVKKYKSFRMEEILFEDENAVIQGPEGAYDNEFIIPFYRNKNGLGS